METVPSEIKSEIRRIATKSERIDRAMLTAVEAALEK
jgi:hypothetical protein